MSTLLLFKVPDIKKMTKIKTKPDKSEHGIEKSAKIRVQRLIKAIYGEDGILKQGCFGWIQNLLDIDSLRSRVLNVGINVADYIRLKTGGRGEHAVMGRQLVWNGDDVHQRAVPTKARSGIEEMQLNSLAEISRMTTLVPCEDSYVWTLESRWGIFSDSFRKEIDGYRFRV
ncbi:hypothetical protein Tco_1370676 [Tanacetum coccineum]